MLIALLVSWFCWLVGWFCWLGWVGWLVVVVGLVVGSRKYKI